MFDTGTAALLSHLAYRDLQEDRPIGPSNRYRVLATTDRNLPSGYYGAVIYDTVNNTTWLASRGTEFMPNIDPNDVLDANLDIAFNSIPTNQLNDAKDFITNYTTSGLANGYAHHRGGPHARQCQ